MAIIVPILLTATGAAGTIAGTIGLTAAMGSAAAATALVSTVASVAFQVTGINDKINKAASKVFGEDLVKVVNIAGAVYGAVNGGFDFGGGGVSADPSALNYANSADMLSDSFSVANAADKLAGGTGLISDGMGGIYNAPGTAGNVIDTLARDGLTYAKEYTPDGGMNSVELGSAKGVNLMDETQALGADTRIGGISAPAAAAPVSGQIGAAGPVASGQVAAGNNASAGQPLKAGGITKGLEPPKMPATATTTPTAKPGSFFDRLLSSDKAMGAVVQGVGGALSSAASARSEKEKLAWQKQRYTQTATTRITQ